MKSKFELIDLARIAVVAAIYVVLTVAIAPLSYGMLQFRFSEILILLCFYKKEYAYSMVVGCLIANLFSPLGIYDVVFGTLATLIIVVLIVRCKSLFLSSLITAINGPIVGFELYYLCNFRDATFLATVLSIIAGELAVVTVIGFPLFKILEKNQNFMKLIGCNKES